MKANQHAVLVSLALALMTSTGLSAPGETPVGKDKEPAKQEAQGGVKPGVVGGAQSADKACREFVEEFYKWYLHNAGSQGYDYALKHRGKHFAPTMVSQLREDEAAQAKHPDGVVGLDSDPILGTQEQPNAIKLGKITNKGDNYLVEVYERFGKHQANKPTVVPELALKNGDWVFVNFHYLSETDPTYKDDLLHSLKDLREERAKDKQGK